MQKKVLAVAVAGALGAPALAFAQAAGTSTVQIYGTLYGEFDYYTGKLNTTSVAGQPSRINFDYFRTAGSEIGVKGEESLGGGLSAWFQCSSTADFRGPASGTPGAGGTTTFANLFGAGTWCSRNSALGMKGFFGNIYAGIWDTPYKRTYAIGNVASGETGAFGNSPILHNGATNPGQTPTTPAGQPAPTEPASANAIAFGAGVSTSATWAGSRGIWTKRETQSIFYDSPVFGGFQVLGHMQFANASTAITRGSTNSKPRTWGVSGQYNAGPLGLGVFYEKHENQGVISGVPAGGVVAPTFAANNSTQDDRSWGLAAAYTFGPVKVGGVWKREEYDVATPGAFGAAPAGMGTHKVNAWHLGVDWNIAGPHGLRAGYTKSGDVKGACLSFACAGGGGIAPTVTGYRPGIGVRPDAQGQTSASMFQVKYVFAFSKRTEIQAGYSRISNSANAAYNYSDITGIAPGQDPHAWVFTMTHKF